MPINTVVIVHDEAHISGGAARIAIESAVELSRQGINVIYFSGVGSVCSELTAAGVHAISLKEEHLGSAKHVKTVLKCLWNPHSYHEFRKLLKTLNPDSTVIHVHGWTKSLSSSIFLAAYKEGFRTIITGHDYFAICQNGGLYNYKKNENCYLRPGSFACYRCNCDKRNGFNKIYRNIRQIIQILILSKARPYFLFISSFSQEIMEPHLYVARKKYFLNNFVDISVRKRVLVENNEDYLYIGRISDEKGIDIFCEAIHKANVSGVVIGEGIKKSTYEKKYPDIRFEGWKDRMEMIPYLEKARALVITSKLHETMGLTVVEMQPFGIPCVVPIECAASEYVKDNLTGVVYSIKNHNELNNSIRKLCDNDYVKNLSVCFYNTLDADKYSVARHISSLIRIYNDMLDMPLK